MNANLVSILSWTWPYKSGAALISMNVLFWFLMHQRPVCVLAVGAFCYYLRYLWKHRIRPEVLVDPPDCEDWTTLSSYDFEQKYISLSKNVWNRWVNLRTENHLMWTTITCTMWILLGKIGSQMDFVTFLFLISNAAFILIPLLKFFPSFELSLSNDDGVIKEEDLIPEVPKKSSKTSKSSITGWTDSSSEGTTPDDPPLAPHPVRIEESQPRRRMSPTLTTALTEGMLSRSISAAAASFVTSGISKSSVMSASAAVISSLAPQFTQSFHPTDNVKMEVAVSPALPRNSSGPDSLTPGISQMPDHEVVDSDPEDEFLFDAKHFDKSSSSSSTSNSFEIINNI
ncbi:unnamed protein product [Orchesella dallaii]|uniref:RETREG1-3/ARL6IP-like N-terminal reticulon-homology domain-containing protein n=1 Tax=Orchesella dallaii TaxID=48710 RepID=A0ABP1PQF1_9HEXA